MEAGHKRPKSGALDLDPMNIHRNIEGAQRRDKRKELQPEQDGRSGNCKHRQQDDKAESSREDDGSAAVSGAEDARQQHCRDRPHPKAEQQQPQYAVVNLKPLLGEGNERRPARDAKARHQKGKPRCKPCLRSIRCQQN